MLYTVLFGYKTVVGQGEFSKAILPRSVYLRDLLFTYTLNCMFSGPSCSKLTTWLVNVSLNFQMLISQICQYFLLKKFEKLLQCFSHFSTKNISVFVYKVVKHLTS